MKSSHALVSNRSESTSNTQSSANRISIGSAQQQSNSDPKAAAAAVATAASASGLQTSVLTPVVSNRSLSSSAVASSPAALAVLRLNQISSQSSVAASQLADLSTPLQSLQSLNQQMNNSLQDGMLHFRLASQPASIAPLDSKDEKSLHEFNKLLLASVNDFSQLSRADKAKATAVDALHILKDRINNTEHSTTSNASNGIDSSPQLAPSSSPQQLCASGGPNRSGSCAGVRFNSEHWQDAIRSSSATSQQIDAQSDAQQTLSALKQDRLQHCEKYLEQRATQLRSQPLTPRIAPEAQTQRDSTLKPQQQTIDALSASSATTATPATAAPVDEAMSDSTLDDESNAADEPFYLSDDAISTYELAVLAVHVAPCYATSNLSGRDSFGSLKGRELQPTKTSFDVQTSNSIQLTATSSGATDASTAAAPLVSRRQRAMLDCLNSAFHIDSQRSARMCHSLQQSLAHNAFVARCVAKHHLQQLDKHSYYKPEAFASQQQYGAWFSRENELLNARLIRCEDLVRSEAKAQDSNPSSQIAANATRESTADAAHRVAPIVVASPDQQRKSSRFARFFCCGSGQKAAQPSATQSNMLPLPASSSGAAPAAATAAAASTRPSRGHSRRASVDENLLRSRFEELNLFSAYSLLLHVLLQDSLSDDSLHQTKSLYTHSPHLADSDTSERWKNALSGEKAQVLQCFASVFRIGSAYRSLAFAQVLSCNLSYSSSYFDAVYSDQLRLSSLYSKSVTPVTTLDHSAESLTIDETRRLCAVMQQHANWSLHCLRRYFAIFHSLDSEDALKQCVTNLMKARATLALVDVEQKHLSQSETSLSALDSISQAIRKAAQSNYESMLQATMPQLSVQQSPLALTAASAHADATSESALMPAPAPRFKDEFEMLQLDASHYAGSIRSAPQCLAMFQLVSRAVERDLQLHLTDPIPRAEPSVQPQPAENDDDAISRDETPNNLNLNNNANPLRSMPNSPAPTDSNPGPSVASQLAATQALVDAHPLPQPLSQAQFNEHTVAQISGRQYAQMLWRDTNAYLKLIGRVDMNRCIRVSLAPFQQSNQQPNSQQQRKSANTLDMPSGAAAAQSLQNLSGASPSSLNLASAAAAALKREANNNSLTSSPVQINAANSSNPNRLSSSATSSPIAPGPVNQSSSAASLWPCSADQSDYLYSHVFRLFARMNEFHSLLQREVTTAGAGASCEEWQPKAVEPLFAPFVSSWIKHLATILDSSFVDRLCALDAQQELAQQQQQSTQANSASAPHGAGVVELFTTLTPMLNQFQSMPFTTAQCVELLTIVAQVVLSYAQRLQSQVEARISFERSSKSNFFFGLQQLSSEDKTSLTASPAMHGVLSRLSSLYVLRRELTQLFNRVQILRAIDRPVSTRPPTPERGQSGQQLLSVNGIQAAAGGAVVNGTHSTTRTSRLLQLQQTENSQSISRSHSRRMSRNRLTNGAAATSASDFAFDTRLTAGAQGVDSQHQQQIGPLNDASQSVFAVPLATALSHIPCVVSTFTALHSVTESLCSLLAQALGSVLCAELQTLVFAQPHSALWSEADAATHAKPLLLYLRLQLSQFESKLYELPFSILLSSILSDALLVLEKLMISPHKEWRNLLTRQQLSRVTLIKDLVVQLLTVEFRLLPAYWLRVQSLHLTRVEFLHHMIAGPVERLVSEYAQISDATQLQFDKLSSNPSQRELLRINATPYMTRQQLLDWIRFKSEVEREGQDDPEIKQLISKHTSHWYDRVKQPKSKSNSVTPNQSPAKK